MDNWGDVRVTAKRSSGEDVEDERESDQYGHEIVAVLLYSL